MPEVLRVFIDDKADYLPEFQEEMRKAGKPIVKGKIAAIGALPNGMQSGRTSVWLSVELEDGRIAFCETSLALLQTASAAFRGRYGDES